MHTHLVCARLFVWFAIYNEISSEASVSDTEQKTEESGGSLTWLWIVIVAVAVIIIALVCSYFFNVKKHPDFLKKNTDKKQ